MATLALPGIRTSTTATRTTTTSTTSFEPAPSAHELASHRADFSFDGLVAAYFDCRRTKRNSPSALAFEAALEHNLAELHDELQSGAYRPGRSICFVITRPKPREVWAADFRDRIVHHLLYRRIAPSIEARFIADSCACIKGRGTLYGARRLEAKVRSITENWRRPASYLKVDIANFFVSVDKRIVWRLLAPQIDGAWWRALAALVLFHDPRIDVEIRGDPRRAALVPPHKRLLDRPPELGLPIGNLSSQFFANVYLDALDQHAKHVLHARHYIRYVDDIVVLHGSPSWLAAAGASIDTFLRAELALALNPAKTILQPVARGVDVVGQVIKPWRRELRRRTVRAALSQLAATPAGDLVASANSYFGLMRQATASRRDRARVANTARARGHSVDAALTKAFRRVAQ